MKKVFAAILLMVLFPNAGFACSLVMSPEFKLADTQHSSTPPPRVTVRNIDFIPWLSDETGSCGGVGFIAIKLSGLRIRDIKNYGVFIRVQSGANEKGLFPESPLALRRNPDGGIELNWAWTGLSPDADGKIRWNLELIPVSRSGVMGTPISVCVASDDSCPKRTKRRS